MARETKARVIGWISHQDHALPAKFFRTGKGFTDEERADSLALPRRVHGHGAKKERRLTGLADPHRPITDASRKRIVIVTCNGAEFGHGCDTLAQPIAGQGRSPRREGEVEQPFDLGAIFGPLSHQAEHRLCAADRNCTWTELRSGCRLAWLIRPWPDCEEQNGRRAPSWTAPSPCGTGCKRRRRWQGDRSGCRHWCPAKGKCHRIERWRQIGQMTGEARSVEQPTPVGLAVPIRPFCRDFPTGRGRHGL